MKVTHADHNYTQNNSYTYRTLLHDLLLLAIAAAGYSNCTSSLPQGSGSMVLINVEIREIVVPQD